ncbi:MAG: hypothetical protein MUD06_02180 [Rhodospirillales bacterium]|nr:hypothetical protein [Rhodospirillales bacterium]
MRCRFAVQTLEFSAAFGRPLFDLTKHQAELAGTWFDKAAAALPIDLSDMQATGGTTYADVAVAMRLPRLRGSVEVRVDRVNGRFDGLALQEDLDSAARAVDMCIEAVKAVFPVLEVPSTSVVVMSWLECGHDKQGVEELLASRQQVQFDPLAVGAKEARFIVRGQLTNGEYAWNLGFGLEPSLIQDYDLYVICQATYETASRHGSTEARWAHIDEVRAKVLLQFGFEVS